MPLPAKTGGRARKPEKGSLPAWLTFVSWGVALGMVALAVFLAVQRVPAASASVGRTSRPASTPTAAAPVASAGQVNLPELAPQEVAAVSRAASLYTRILERPSLDGATHTVTEGDSVFGLAEQFKLKPETVLWANFTVLKDNPDLLSIGQVLNIPPTDGVFYKWAEGDTIEAVAAKFKAKANDILLWPGNHLDLANPKVGAGMMVMVPGGKREFVRTWVLPTIPRGAAGVTTNLPGSCNTGAGGAYGTGAFIWPSTIRTISGNTYWSGHLAIDIAIAVGMPVMAADSGVVVYAGADYSGYGNVVLIDHGNGYQTLYAHLSAIFVRCGQSVFKGGTIASGGSTGNSTGPHLHFEIRYLGGFVNPISYIR